jgi:hypothetical protein
MKYYMLFAKDQRAQNWVLRFIDKKADCVKFRAEYEGLRCTGCGKVDEFAALRQGVVPEVGIRSRFDFVESSDGVLCVSRRLREVLEENGIGGLEYIEMPGDENYFAVLPTCLVETDVSKAGYTVLGVCALCGRAKERSGLPPLGAMRVPGDVKTFFEPSVQLESTYMRRDLLCASVVVVGVMKKSKVTGVEYSLMAESGG